MAHTKEHEQGIYPEVVEVTERYADLSLLAITKQCADLEANRLDEQHIFITKTLGFLIHPNIPDPGPESKIADIGTGTGIWLLGVAKAVPPTCRLVGFDATSSSFPPPSTVPSNVSFKIQDMHRPFPESEVGTYDL